jgi:pilus assembly protein FimV
MLSKRLTIRTLALPLLAAALCGAPRAAELGEIKVNSHIGQQLSADIELVDLTAADLADIQARLANPDVFKGANVAMPPALGGLYISIAKRDNKRFLHLTTLQPVNAEALHLFLELNSGGRQIIRAASLWLTPEPPGQRPVTVAAMPAAEPASAAAAAKSAAPAPATVSPPSQSNSEAGLNEAAQRAFAHRQQVAMAKAREQSLNPPPQPAPAAVPKPEPDRAPEPAPSARKVTPKPAAAAATASAPAITPAPSAAAALSCAPAKQVEAQLRQCEAMTSKLADIEGKVQRLQIAAVAPAAAAATSASAPVVAAPKAEAAPAKPGAAPAKLGATPVKPGVAADLAANPRSRMMMIAGGVLAGLAALGGAIYFMRKRQAKGPLKIWQSFRKKWNAEDDVPTLEDAVEVAAH